MSTYPTWGFIMAAGMGKRLRPYTDTMPKPMVPIAGKPVIDHTVGQLVKAGVTDICVNLHYYGDMLRDHLSATHKNVNFHFFPETELLDTGLGVKKALPLIGDQPFYVINGDAFWENGEDDSALLRLAKEWDPARMEVLMLLEPVDRMILTKGVGDYDFDEATGRMTRSKTQQGKYMWGGIRICDSRSFENTPDTPFSFLKIFDAAEARGQLVGIVHDGAWHHISTPAELEAVDAVYTENRKKKDMPEIDVPKLRA
ncbi:MAG: NTP transferase domain-containing protein [Alphaproteobacteria bacterium]|nr:NTP transferase domain-containing protein [Alphaproteobacteria bacterium]